MTEVRRLGDGGRRAAARSLGDAFADDPVFAWLGRFDGITHDAAAARTALTFSAAIDARFRRGDPLIYTLGDHDAVTIWDRPGAGGPTFGEILRSIIPLWRAFGTGIVDMRRLLDVMDAHHPSEPHYYLFAIGVRNDRQGTGLGSALLRPMLDRCDREGVAAYLENSRERNTAFYARHGFEALDPLPVPDGCPPMLPMLRRPR